MNELKWNMNSQNTIHLKLIVPKEFFINGKKLDDNKNMINKFLLVYNCKYDDNNNNNNSNINVLVMGNNYDGCLLTDDFEDVKLLKISDLKRKIVESIDFDSIENEEIPILFFTGIRNIGFLIQNIFKNNFYISGRFETENYFHKFYNIKYSSKIVNVNFSMDFLIVLDENGRLASMGLGDKGGLGIGSCLEENELKTSDLKQLNRFAIFKNQLTNNEKFIELNGNENKSNSYYTNLDLKLKFKKIFTSNHQAFAISEDNTLFVWGYNKNYELGCSINLEDYILICSLYNESEFISSNNQFSNFKIIDNNSEELNKEFIKNTLFIPFETKHKNIDEILLGMQYSLFIPNSFNTLINEKIDKDNINLKVDYEKIKNLAYNFTMKWINEEEINIEYKKEECKFDKSLFLFSGNNRKGVLVDEKLSILNLTELSLEKLIVDKVVTDVKFKDKVCQICKKNSKNYSTNNLNYYENNQSKFSILLKSIKSGWGNLYFHLCMMMYENSNSFSNSIYIDFVFTTGENSLNQLMIDNNNQLDKDRKFYNLIFLNDFDISNKNIDNILSKNTNHQIFSYNMDENENEKEINNLLNIQFKIFVGSAFCHIVYNSSIFSYGWNEHYNLGADNDNSKFFSLVNKKLDKNKIISVLTGGAFCYIFSINNLE